MIGIDKSEQYYWNKEKATGFWCEDYKKKNSCNIKHEKYYGYISAEVVEKIGYGIDFLFLDTIHFLPGELLDFIIFLPYLADDCIVVLHDIALSHVQLMDDKAIATKILFDVVTAEKFYVEDCEYGDYLSNIAAFRITKETKENIKDLFSAMMIGWNYIPEPCDIDAYKQIINKEYDEILYHMFTSTLNLQYKSVPMRLIPMNYRGNFSELKEKWRKTEKFTYLDVACGEGCIINML